MNASLTPCPRCSSRVLLVRPQWNYARHTSAKREREALAGKKPDGVTTPGIRCYIWVGQCAHGSAFYDNFRNPTSDEPEIAAVEKRWHAHALDLFCEMTARWTAAQRDLHARTLGIELPPEAPAQQKPKTDNDND